MTNVKFPREEIEKQVKLTPEIIEKISLLGTPLEKIDDKELEIEVFPNRPDLISMHGFLRAFKTFLGKKVKNYELKKPEKNYKVKVEPSINKIRPYTVCAIVKNLNFNDQKIKEIIELQEKLHITIGRNRKKAAIGIYPLEEIKLPITYTAKKPSEIKFIPLGYEKEMNASQILKIHPTGIEYSKLLKEYKEYPVFIDSNKEVLSMPPVINSNKTGRVTEKTKEVFVECSGHDLEILKKILNIIVTTLIDLGGEAYQMEIQYPKKIITPDLTPEKRTISLERTNKLLGLKLKETDLKKLLEKMGHEYKNKNVHVPAWRTDILHEVDLIEDVAIAYGYDKFEEEIPNVATIAEESESSKIKSKIKEITIGLGLTEISSYHLIKEEEAKKIKLKDRIELETSKTEYKILRPDLLTPTLRILSENKDNEYPQNLFEIGEVFSSDKKEETGIKENTNLIVSLSPGNFTTIKQHLDYLMNSLDLKYELKDEKITGFIEGRAGKITVNKKEIGIIGEMHPLTLHDWSLKMPLAVFEIDLSFLYPK